MVTASQLIRAIAKGLGRGSVYNDVRKGYRSFKIEGWNREDYDLARAVLEAAGYQVEYHTTPPLGPIGRSRPLQHLRMHVR